MAATIAAARVCRWSAVLLLFLLIGCAGPKVDWAGRVGHFTYDQAVLQLGPPDKQVKLADGTIVAEWLTQRGYTQFYSAGGYGYPYGWYGPYYPAYVNSFSPNYYLRLIFGPDGNLREWKKFAK